MCTGTVINKKTKSWKKTKKKPKNLEKILKASQPIERRKAKSQRSNIKSKVKGQTQPAKLCTFVRKHPAYKLWVVAKHKLKPVWCAQARRARNRDHFVVDTRNGSIKVTARHRWVPHYTGCYSWNGWWKKEVRIERFCGILKCGGKPQKRYGVVN